MTHQNIHACALVIGTCGILIEGPSGSGKTLLMLHLLERAAAAGQFASMVCDDRVMLSANNDRLIMRQVDTLSSLVEIWGLDIAPLRSIPSAVAGLLVETVEAELLERLPQSSCKSVEGVELPHIKVPARDELRAARMIFSRIETLD